MVEIDFLEILRRNNEDEIRMFMLRFGKKPKPFSPIYFFDPQNASMKGDNVNERWRVNNE